MFVQAEVPQLHTATSMSPRLLLRATNERNSDARWRVMRPTGQSPSSSSSSSWSRSNTPA
jgi:hypothetical protein